MWNHFSHHFRDKKEMIVVYPDCITPFVLAYDDVGKRTIYCDVMLPAILLPNLEFRIDRDLIVECWPENLLAIAIIMALEIGVGNEYGNRTFLGVEECTNPCLLSVTQCIRRLQFSKSERRVSPFQECQSIYNLAKLQSFGQNG
jgi:hypothetical protein